MRAATRRPKPLGANPRPRRRLNPKLYDTVRASGRPYWKLAAEAGLTHEATFSALVLADEVPDTPTNIERLQRIADVVGFDPGQLFLDSGSR